MCISKHVASVWPKKVAWWSIPEKTEKGSCDCLYHSLAYAFIFTKRNAKSIGKTFIAAIKDNILSRRFVHILQKTCTKHRTIYITTPSAN